MEGAVYSIPQLRNTCETPHTIKFSLHYHQRQGIY